MPKTSMKPKSEYAIQTVTNALRMLEVFHSESEMGVSDLARKLGLHKNNAFRLLATLELAGYIQQTESTELYHLGPRCLELGHAFARSHTLMIQARPILEELAAETGETAHLAVLRDVPTDAGSASAGATSSPAGSGRGNSRGSARGSARDSTRRTACQVVHLDGVLPDQLVLTGLRVGERTDAHCTALGKTLLAGRLDRSRFDSGATADANTNANTDTNTDTNTVTTTSADGSAASDAAHAGASQGAPLSDFSDELADATRTAARHTENTICDRMKLMEEIGTVAMRGYGTDFGEFALGLNCVAAPVRDASARVIAALSLSGPSMRLDEAAVHGPAAVAIRRAAERLSKELGANPGLESSSELESSSGLEAAPGLGAAASAGEAKS